MVNDSDKTTRKIARSAGAVSVAVMCSRILGLVREQVFAGLFGAGYAYDAFVVAFRIPNLLRDLFGEGALSAAFVTVFAEYDSKQGGEATWRLASNVLIFIFLLLLGIVLVGSLLAGPIVKLLAPDFRLISGKTALTVTLTRIMFPFLILVAMSAVVMGMLNAKDRFFIPALSSSFFNLGSIVGGTSLALFFHHLGLSAIAGMAWGTLIGGLLQLLVQLPLLRKIGFTLHWVLDLADPGLRKVLLLMLPATVGLSATQINIFVNTNFASSCAQGSVSWLNYAFRLVQLPIGVFGVALSVAIMPVLARQAATRDLASLRQTFTSSLVMVFSLAIPATAGLIILSRPIIRLIFEHGAFTAIDTSNTSQALVCYSLGLFAYAAVKVMVPVFYALGDTKFPVISSFISVVVNIILISQTIALFQHRAIALSTSATMVVSFLFLGSILYIKLEGYSLPYLLKSCIKIGCSTGVMVVLLLIFRQVFTPWLAGSLLSQLAAVLGMVLLGAMAYGAVLRLLRLSELVLITERIVQRFARS